MNKKIFAPKVDNYIFQAERTHKYPDEATKALILKIFKKIGFIDSCGEDEIREIWLKAERGGIEEFGDYETYVEYGEVESSEEFFELWQCECPHPVKWYLLSTAVYKDYYTVCIDRKPVLAIWPENSEGYPCDNSDLACWILQGIDEAIKSLKEGTYNKNVRKELPYSKRLGKILRKKFWEIFPDVKEEYLKDMSPEEISGFIKAISDQPEKSPENRLAEMTASIFFDCCKWLSRYGHVISKRTLSGKL